MPVKRVEVDPCADAARSSLFEEVWEVHSPELFRSCLRWMSGRSEDAQEAFSRVSLIGLVKFPAADLPTLAQRAWLLRVARNVCIDLLRERKRRVDRFAGEPAEDCMESYPASSACVDVVDPERLYLQREFSTFLFRCIHNLSPRLRAVMHLRLVQEKSYREIAEALAIEEGNVRKRVQQARSILAGQLSEYRRTGKDSQTGGSDRFSSVAESSRGSLLSAPGPGPAIHETC